MTSLQDLPFATSDRPLEGLRALVTGASGGLGSAISRELAAAGASIAVADLREPAATELARALERDHGIMAVPMHLDVASEDSVGRAFEASQRELGGVDILINNAGTDKTVPIEELSVADWDTVLGTNLRGPFLLSRQAFQVMREAGGGQIVNIVSTAAKRAWANAAAYHASKWGLLGLSHALHVEGRAQNIKVTAVITGGMRTPFLLDRFPDIDPDVLQDPATVAKTVRFVLLQPAESVIPEITVIPMRETSWP